MSQEIDRNVVEMRFDNAQFEQGVKTSMKTIDKLKQSLNFESAVKGIDQINSSVKKVDVSPMTQAVEQLQVKFSTLDIVAATVISRLTNTVLNAGKKIADSTLGQIMSGGWRRATNIDQAKFSLSGLGIEWGNIDKELSYAVNQTAYGLDAAAKAAASLAASNVSLTKSTGRVDTAFERENGELNEMAMALRAISGVAAQTNSDYEDISQVFTRVAGNGKLMAMELNMLSSRGLNAAAVLGDALGKSETEIREMTRKGQISFQMFSEAMYDAFGEHAVKANETFEGAMSNMKAAMSKIGAEFAAPIREGLIGPFNALRLMFNQIKENIKPIYQGFAKFTKIASSGVVRVIELFTEGLKDSPLQEWADLGGLADIGWSIYNVFNALYRILMPIGKAFRDIFPTPTANTLKNISAGIREFTENLMISEGAMTGIHAVFKGVFAILKALIKIIGSVLKIVSPIVGIATKILSIILSLIGGLGNYVASILDAEKVTEAFKIVLVGIGKTLGIFIGTIIFVISKIVEFGKRVYELASTSELLNNVFNGIKEGIKVLGASILGIISLLGNLVMNIGPALNKLFNTSPSSILGAAEKCLIIIKDTLVNIYDNIKKILSEINKTNVFNNVSKFVNVLKTSLVNALNYIGNKIISIKNAFVDITGNIKDFITSFSKTSKISTDLDNVAKSAEKLNDNLGGAMVKNNKMYAMTSPKNLKLNAEAMDALSKETGRFKDNAEGATTTVVELNQQYSQFSKKAEMNTISKGVEETTKSLSFMDKVMLKIKETIIAISQSKLVTTIKDFAIYLKNKIVDVLTKIKNVLKEITEQIRKFISSISVSKIMAASFSMVLIVVGLSLTKLLNNLSSISVSINGLFKTLTNTIDNFSFFSKRSRSAIIDIAVSIAIVTGALYLLNKTFKEGSLSSKAALDYLVTIMAGLGALEIIMLAMVAIGKDKKASDSVLNVSLTLISIAGSVLILAEALKKLQGLTLKKSFESIKIMTVLLSEMMVVSYVLGNLNKGNKLSSPTLAIIAFTFAIGKLVQALKDIMALTGNKDDMELAVASLTGLIMALGFVAAASRGIDLAGVVGLTMAVIAIRLALPLLEKLLDRIHLVNQDGIPIMDTFRGFLEEFSDILFKMAAIAVGVIAVGSMFGKNILPFGIGMILFSYAIDNMLICVNKLKAIELDILDDSMAVIETFFGLFILIGYFSKYTEKSHMIAFSTSLYMMTGVVSLLVKLSEEIGKLPDDILTKLEVGTKIISWYMLLVGSMAGLSGLGSGGLTNVAGVAIALGEIFGYLIILSSDFFEEDRVLTIGNVVKDLLSVITAMYAAIALISAMHPDTKQIENLRNTVQSITAMVGVLTVSLSLMAFYLEDVSGLTTITNSFVMLIGSLSVMFAVIGNIDKNKRWWWINEEKFKVIKAATESIIALLTGIAFLTVYGNDKLDAITSTSLAISVALIAYSKVIDSIGKLRASDNKGDYDKKAEIIKVVGNALAVILTSLAFMSNMSDPAKTIITTVAICTLLKVLLDGISKIFNASTPNNGSIINKKLETMDAYTKGLAALMLSLVSLSLFTKNGTNIILGVGAIYAVMTVYDKLLKSLLSTNLPKNADTLIKTLREITYGLISLGAALTLMGIFGNPTAIVSGMIGMSACLVAYSYTLKQIVDIVNKYPNDIEKATDTIKKGILAMSAISFVLNAFSGANVSSVGATMMGIGTALAGFAYTLKEIINVVKSNNPKDIDTALKIIIDGIVLLSAFTYAMTKLPMNADWKTVSATFAGISVCMLAYAESLKLIDNMNVVINNSDKVFKLLLGSATSAIIFATALAILATASWDEISSAVGGIGLALAEYLGVLYILNKMDIKDTTFQNLITFLIETAVGLGVVGLVLAGLANIPWTDVWTPLAAMGAALAGFLGVVYVLSKLNDAMKDIGNAFALAASLAVSMVVLSVGFLALAHVPWAGFEGALTPMVAVLGMLTAISAFAAKVGDKAAGGLIVFALGLTILAAVIATFAASARTMANSFDDMSKAFTVMQSLQLFDIASGLQAVLMSIVNFAKLNITNGVIQLNALNNQLFKMKDIMNQQLYIAGIDGMHGLAEGFKAGVGYSANGLVNAADVTMNAFRKFVGWHSPWLSMIAAGHDGLLGLALGFIANAHYGAEAAEQVGETVTVAMDEKLSNGAAIAGEKSMHTLAKAEAENADEAIAVTEEVADAQNTVLTVGGAAAGTNSANATGKALTEGWNRISGPLGELLSSLGDALGTIFVNGFVNSLNAGFDELMANYSDLIAYINTTTGWNILGVTDETGKRWREMASENWTAALEGFGEGVDKALTSMDKFIDEADLGGIIEQIAGGGLKDQYGDLFNFDFEEYASDISGAGMALDGFGESATGTGKTVKDLAKSLYDSMSAFSEFDKKTTMSASTVLKNMQSQIDGMKNWSAGVANLKGRISDAMYQYLVEQGTSGYELVNALNSMSSAELKYADYLYQKQIAASLEAAVTVKNGVVETAKDGALEIADETAKANEKAAASSRKYTANEIANANKIKMVYEKEQKELSNLRKEIEKSKGTAAETPLRAEYKRVEASMSYTKKQYNNAMSIIGSTVKENKKATDAIEKANEGIIGEASTVVTVLGPAGAQLVELSELEAKQAVTSETMGASFSSLANSIRKYSKEADIGEKEVAQLARQFIKANPDILSMGMSVEDVTEALMQMEIEMSSVHETIKKQVNDSIKIFEKWDDEFELSEEDLLENMHSQIRGLTKWSGQLEQLSKKGIDAGLLSYLQSLGPQGAEYVNAFAQMTSEELADASATYAHAMNLGDEIADQLVDSYSETGYFLSDGFAEGITNGTGKAEKSAIELGNSALDKLREVLDEHSPSRKGYEIGEYLGISVPQGMLSNLVKNTLMKNCMTLGNLALTDLKNSLKINQMIQLGADLIRGLANGISNNSTIAITAVSKTANLVVAAAKKAFNSHSPSRVFEEIGKFDDQGLANGLIKYSYLAYNAANDMAEETLAGFNNGYSGISSVIDWDDLNPVISPTLDLTEVTDGVQQLNSMIDETAEAKVGFDAYSDQNESAEPRMVFNQYNNSPKALDRIEIYRQTKNLISTSKG